MSPSYLREVIADNTNASAKRFALVIATLALGVATVALSIAACLGVDVSVALGTVTVPLSGMAGYSYIGGKKIEAASAQPAGA